MTSAGDRPDGSALATAEELEELRGLLLALGDAIRDEVLDHRDRDGVDGMAAVVGRTAADTIYAVDRVGEERVRAWLDEHWPPEQPLVLVMEGVEDAEAVRAPTGAAGEPRWVLIVDPVDGTRNLMYDKRPAWVLAALAPHPPPGDPPARLGDLVVAAMTEIPTTKQRRADQVSAVRGAGPDGVVAEGIDLAAGTREELALRPSTATTLDHGFASFAHYLPDGKARLAALEQDLLDELVPPGPEPRQVFEDQYICSAGQLYELLAGHDRVVGDLRPLALAAGGLPLDLACHPYDLCAALVFTESGGVLEDPRGGPVDAPLDTTSPVTWVGYANPVLAELVRPVLARLIDEHFGDAGR